MKNIVLVCAAGMSTSLLVNKMKDAAKEENFECTINAYSASSSSEAIKKSDIVMLGPQVKYLLEKMRKENPDKTIVSIDMRMYGAIDGKGVLNQAKELMGV